MHADRTLRCTTAIEGRYAPCRKYVVATHLITKGVLMSIPFVGRRPREVGNM